MSEEGKFVGLSAGVDCNGQPARLGEFDSQGHIVGYIDEDSGACWESLRERDCAVTAGRYEEAMVRFRRGELKEPPDPDAFAREHCKDPANHERAAHEAVDQLSFYDQLRRLLPTAGGFRQAINSLPDDDERARAFAEFLSWILDHRAELGKRHHRLASESEQYHEDAFRRWLEQRGEEGL